MSQPEKPWIVFSAAVQEMVGPTLDTNRRAIEALADRSDQQMVKLANQVGELAEAQREVMQHLKELRARPAPQPGAQGRVSGSFAPIYEFNEWLGQMIVAQEELAHRTAATLRAENRELQSRLAALERRLDNRGLGASRWLLGFSLPAVLIVVLFLAM